MWIVQKIKIWYNKVNTLIINVEAQKRLNPKKKTGDTYPLLKRAVYYASRLISSQKGTEFTNSDYDKIKKVYTIWICMESPTWEKCDQPLSAERTASAASL